MAVADAPPNGHRLRGAQLTFNLGAGREAEPDYATLKIGGEITVERDLLYKESVIVTVTDRDGEVIATSPATIGWPQFKDKSVGDLEYTIRAHTATLD